MWSVVRGNALCTALAAAALGCLDASIMVIGTISGADVSMVGSATAFGLAGIMGLQICLNGIFGVLALIKGDSKAGGYFLSTLTTIVVAPAAALIVMVCLGLVHTVLGFVRTLFGAS